MSVIELLLGLLIICIVLGAAWYILTTLLPMPEPIGRIVQAVFVVVVVIVVVWFLTALFGVTPRFIR